MKVDDFIKTKLLERGFTEKDIINNRGLINATIDETKSAFEKFGFQDMQYRFLIDKKEDLELVRQWFNAVHDFNPNYLKNEDYLLAKNIYEILNIRVPDSYKKNVCEHEWHMSPDSFDQRLHCTKCGKMA